MFLLKKKAREDDRFREGQGEQKSDADGTRSHFSGHEYNQ
jgi:hypothetical protein